MAIEQREIRVKNEGTNHVPQTGKESIPSNGKHIGIAEDGNHSSQSALRGEVVMVPQLVHAVLPSEQVLVDFEKDERKKDANRRRSATLQAAWSEMTPERKQAIIDARRPKQQAATKAQWDTQRELMMQRFYKPVDEQRREEKRMKDAERMRRKRQEEKEKRPLSVKEKAQQEQSALVSAARDRDIYAQLPLHYQQILNARYPKEGQQRTFQDIANEQNRTRQNMQQRERDAIALLRKLLNNQ